MNQNILQSINAVEGFDPVEYAVDYTDLNSGETRKRLPVMIQMAWFRLRYPEGKISIEVMPRGGDRFPRPLPGQTLCFSPGMGADGSRRHRAPQCRFRSAVCHGR